MDIFETLRIDHAAIRDLLNQIIAQTEPGSIEGLSVDSESREDWPEAFHDLKLALIGHNRAEESVFYDLLNRIPHRRDLIDIKTKEHHLIEEILEDLEEINPADYSWANKLSLLKNELEAHFAEEETMVFSTIEPVLDADEAERLAGEFNSLRDDLVEGAPYHPKGKSIVNPAGLDLNS